ncbi:hypothetical protein AB25_4852 [Escherichia coli 2-005-03_S1_C2]|nr:putative 50S ribosomal protein L33 [Escherichia coli]EFZ57322.1 hypothetical protein ECLT68_3885 [Escherichia coli LT-68]EGI88937.1 hypothetical protein SD15574_5296 [Shigella dysenteriae 155-74]EGW98683.1 hypothetical protein ECSTECDG1313_0122 [Escherichia coli STEC_DG131-3]EHW08369.1 hypothetical protein ECDEC8C_6119 [Escherichia coli DEC8C]EHX02276.1 hypothetical protein ECDEC10F_0117 [Escherichia coli DEC10F]EIH90572.1 putative 50S ribosomal protein L33 [Escherichia coli JB1-95]EII457
MWFCAVAGDENRRAVKNWRDLPRYKLKNYTKSFALHRDGK